MTSASVSLDLKALYKSVIIIIIIIINACRRWLSYDRVINIANVQLYVRISLKC